MMQFRKPLSSTAKADRLLGLDQKKGPELKEESFNPSAPEQTHLVVYYFSGTSFRPFGHVALWDGENYFSWGAGSGNFSHQSLTEEDANNAAEREVATYGPSQKIRIPVDRAFIERRSSVQREGLGLTDSFPLQWQKETYCPLRKNCAHFVEDYLIQAGIIAERPRSSMGLRPIEVAQQAEITARSRQSTSSFMATSKGRSIRTTSPDAKLTAHAPGSLDETAKKRAYLHNLKEALKTKGNTLDNCWFGGTHSGILYLKSVFNLTISIKQELDVSTLTPSAIDTLYSAVTKTLKDKRTNNSLFRKKEAHKFYEEWANKSDALITSKPPTRILGAELVLDDDEEEVESKKKSFLNLRR